MISTDPPYYDNIAYADLSDFFYVWMKRSLAPIYPELFGLLAVPKAMRQTSCYTTPSQQRTMRSMSQPIDGGDAN